MRMRTRRRTGWFRSFLVKTIVLAVFTLLGARLVYVQGMMRTELRQRADRQIPADPSLNHVRHPILDRNGLPLAETVQVFSCYVDPTMIREPKRAAAILAGHLGLESGPLLARMKSSKGSFMWVKRDVPAPLVAKIKGERIDGVGFKLEYRRHYPLGPIAPHLLGLVGIDGRGLSGIEQKFDGVLTSNKQSGGPVQLTLDGMIQQIAERELDWAARKTKAKKGMVLIQDPDTGEILAMAHWPAISLDPDNPPQPDELRIPSLSDVFEPGSTFKIVVAAAALEEHIMDETELFDCEKGSWRVADIKIRDHHPMGQMTLADIVIHSSNIGAAKIAERVGSEKLYQYARLFGFGVYPGSGLPGEIKGILRHPSNWSGVSKYIVAFGQEVGVTAIQLIGAYSSVANSGRLMEPRFVKEVGGETDTEDIRPSIVRRVISKRTCDKLKTILAGVVTRGTGINAQIRTSDQFSVAGKTGTAQKFDNVSHRYRDDLTLVSFCGFFPVQNPKLTMLVLLDEPEGRRWGGADAAPLFRRIAEQVTSQIYM